MGSVIHGTLIVGDVFTALVDELACVCHDQKLVDAYEALDLAGDPTWEDVDDLMCLLNRFAPQNHYFGVHPGSGSDFGWWEKEVV